MRKKRTVKRAAPVGRATRKSLFARKLAFLLNAIPSPDGDPYSLQEIAKGTRLSVSYLAMLKHGRRRNPTLETVKALTDFFGVPPSFFYEDVDPTTLQGVFEVREIQRRVNEAQIALTDHRLEEAETLLRGVASGIHPLVPQVLQSRFKWALGRLHRLRGNHIRAGEILRDALTTHPATTSSSQRVEILLELGRVEYEQQRYQEAFRHYNRALEEITEGGQGISENQAQTLQLQALQALGVVSRRLGRLEDSLRYLTEGLALAERMADPRRLAHIYMGLGLVHKDLDRTEAALQASTQALEIYRSIEDVKLIADTQHNMALALLASERYIEARQLLEQSLRTHQTVRDDRGLGHDHMALGRYFFNTGDYAQARQWTREALELFRRLHLPEETGEGLLQLAGIAARAGNRDEATRTFKEAMALFEQHTLKAGLARALRTYAEALELWGDHREAGGLYRRSLQLYDEIRMGAD